MKTCPSCQHEVPEGSRFCGACGEDTSLDVGVTRTFVRASPASPGTPPPVSHAQATSGVGRLSVSDTLEPTRFAPAEIIAERYRIIGLIGKGGMGEVYRADDLKLGQAVALKFLPEALGRNESRLRRFLDEVRVARQVSHANVCRVYDIGEHAGHHYISMEYVDGEDLSSLIRRIGRISEDKALQIARQVCSGLAAAHAKGIVHRDLKPSNVMIDGEGQARITDFGLAGLAQGFAGEEIRVGTPAYMSPEQLAGTEVTLRSDIYSLGLLLFELFSGKPVFQAKTLVELTRQRSDTTSQPPRLGVAGIDPRVERAIQRCLEPDPANRPATSLAVLGALPGGDPLAAALEAGETPSPAMVANAGDGGGLRPGLALGLLALTVLGVAGLFGLSSQYLLLRHFDMRKPPAALVVQAREAIRELGYDEPPADTLFGFGMDAAYERHVTRENQSPDRWDDVGRVRPASFFFWYRESPRQLVPVRASGSASYSNPPMTISGMVAVLTDTDGRLLDFVAVPPEKGAAGESPADWGALLDAAGLDPALLEPSDPEWNPLVDCDHRVAWSGTYPEQPDLPIRVEAGSFAGKPVYFTVVAPWTEPSRMQEPERGGAYAGNVISLVLISLAVVAGVLLAQWVLHVHHVRSLAELGMFADALQGALFFAALAWVIYVALEPYARRQWPHALISWSRLLGGRFRDPLVGRDLLLGSLVGVTVALLIVVAHLIPIWLGTPSPPAPIPNAVAMLGGLHMVAGSLFGAQPGAMVAPIAIFFLIFGLRIVVRKQWIAIGVTFALMSLVQGLQMENAALLGWTAAAAVWALLIFVIVRLGVLAGVISFVYANMLLALPLTTDFSAWYADRAWFGLAALALVTGYGFYLSLAGRPVFADALLQDA